MSLAPIPREGGGGEAAGRVFLQALQAERVEVGGDLVVEQFRRRVLAGDVRPTVHLAHF